MTKILISNYKIGHNHANIHSVLDEVDPATGNRKIKAEIQWVNPGEFIDWPDDDEAARMIASGHAREPTADELRLRQFQD
jgi:hypothetical protein